MAIFKQVYMLILRRKNFAKTTGGLRLGDCKLYIHFVASRAAHTNVPDAYPKKT